MPTSHQERATSLNITDVTRPSSSTTPSPNHKETWNRLYDTKAFERSTKYGLELVGETVLLESSYLILHGLLHKHEELLSELDYWKTLSKKKQSSPCKKCPAKEETLSRANDKISFLENVADTFAEAVRTSNPATYNQLRAQLEDSERFHCPVQPEVQKEVLKRIVIKEELRHDKENIPASKSAKKELQFTTPSKSSSRSRTVFAPLLKTPEKDSSSDFEANFRVLVPETMPLNPSPTKLYAKTIIPETLDFNENCNHWHSDENADADVDQTRFDMLESVDATFYNPPSPILSARKGKLTTSQSSVKAKTALTKAAGVWNTEDDLQCTPLRLPSQSPSSKCSQSPISQSPSLLRRFKMTSSPSENNEPISRPPTPPTPKSSPLPALQNMPLKITPFIKDSNNEAKNITEFNKEADISLDGSFLAPSSPEASFLLLKKNPTPKVVTQYGLPRKRLLEPVSREKHMKQAKLSRTYFNGQVRVRKTREDTDLQKVLKESALYANAGRGDFPVKSETEDSFNSLQRLKNENGKLNPGYADGKAPRKKAERMQLEGWDCPECKKYYQAMSQLSEEERKARMNWCSKHRKEQPYMSSTPPGMWDPFNIASPVPQTPDYIHNNL